MKETDKLYAEALIAAGIMTGGLWFSSQAYRGGFT